MCNAVEYCKVSFKWCSTWKVDSSSLGESRGKIHFAVRENDEPDEEDIFEATLNRQLNLENDEEFLSLALID